MAISHSIDGTSDSSVNQIFDLLAVMADPKAYNEKLKALQTAIDENKKFVSLVGPANEIVALRDMAKQELTAAKEAAAKTKAEAQKKADALVKQSEDMLSEAQKSAAEIKAAVEQELKDAKAKNAALSEELRAVQSERNLLEKAHQEAKNATEKAVEKQKAADKAAKEAAEYRDMIAAKHKALIESIA